MRILVPFVTIVMGLSMVSSMAAAKIPSRRMTMSPGAPSFLDTYKPNPAHHQQIQEVHVNSIATPRRRLSIDNHSKLLLRKRAPPPAHPSGGSGTVVGSMLGGSNKPVVLDTSPDPTDKPQSKPNPHEVFVGPVLEKKLLDLNTPGAATPTKGPPSPMLKLNTEHHNIVEATVPDMKQTPVGMGNQKPPPTP